MQLKDLPRAFFPRGESSSHPRQRGRVRSLSLHVRCTWPDVACSVLTTSLEAHGGVVQSSHSTEEEANGLPDVKWLAKSHIQDG